eukprot:scaffold307_cov63-Phaeocystis_antarctica.AAC.4
MTVHSASSARFGRGESANSKAPPPRLVALSWPRRHWAGTTASLWHPSSLTVPARRIETRPRRSCGSSTPAAPSSVVLKLSARLTSSDRTYPVPSMERSMYCAVPAPNLPSTMTRSFSMRLAVLPAYESVLWNSTLGSVPAQRPLKSATELVWHGWSRAGGPLRAGPQQLQLPRAGPQQLMLAAGRTERRQPRSARARGA